MTLQNYVNALCSVSSRVDVIVAAWRLRSNLFGFVVSITVPWPTFIELHSVHNAHSVH